MKLFGAVIVILGFALCALAGAQEAGPACSVFKIEQIRGVPQDILAFFARLQSAEFFRRHGPYDGVAVRRCKNNAGNTVTSFLGSVEKSAGVCSYRESDMSDLFSAAGKFLAEKLEPGADLLIAPGVHMLVTDAACPRQDNSSFIFAEAVSPGLFRMLVTAYTQLASTPGAFDVAFSELKSNDQTAAKIAFLKQGMAARSWRAPRIVSVNYGKQCFSRSNVACYSVSSNDGWSVYFDLTPIGLKVLDLDLAYR
jgi:hypothetical protein